MSRWPQETVDLALAEVFQAACTHGQLGMLGREWLVLGFLRSVRDGIPLDAALGLCGGGSRTLRRRLLTEQRDVQLARALVLVALDAEVSVWERCKRLAPLAQRFCADVWPRASRLAAPPSDWPEWKQALFNAARTGLELPASAKGMQAAWKRVGGYSVPRAADPIRLRDYL